MKLHGTMSISRGGHLEIGGCDTVELVKKYGTPLYVIDEAKIHKNCQEYVGIFKQNYPKFEVIYASKAFCNMAMCQLVKEEGLSLDVVSGGELYTAMKAGFPTKKIYFHGNNKTPNELKMAINENIGRIVIDSLYELELINEIAGQHGIKQSILMRVSPGIDAHTHEYIKTGLLDSKFGLAICNGQAMEAIKQAVAMPNISLEGIHCHIGSQIFELNSFVEAVAVMFSFINEIRAQIGCCVHELNLGGGLGVYYTETDTPCSIEELVKIIAASVRKAAKEYDLPLPKLIIEPGRSIVGEAGTTLYTIGAIKEIPNIRKYVAVDGGMFDNPRPALYQAQHEAMLANKMNESLSETVSIAGKCCESGDMLIWDIELPHMNSGDILAVSTTGAYNYSMASNYNRNSRPAVIFVQKGNSKIVVKRETYEDLIKNDVLT